MIKTNNKKRKSLAFKVGENKKSLLVNGQSIDFIDANDLIEKLKISDFIFNSEDVIFILKNVEKMFPEDMSEFLQLFSSHKEKVSDLMQISCNILETNAINHDIDKVINDETFSIYSKHFPTLKKIEFGTKEYKDYEQNNFKKAHYNHNQNEHQFYCEEHEQDTKVDLFVINEVICDIIASATTYGNYDAESITNIIFNKPTMKNYIAKETIYNTVVNLLNKMN